MTPANQEEEDPFEGEDEEDDRYYAAVAKADEAITLDFMEEFTVTRTQALLLKQMIIDHPTTVRWFIWLHVRGVHLPPPFDTHDTCCVNSSGISFNQSNPR